MVRLQDQSGGIKDERSGEHFLTCTFYEDSVGRRDEAYVFRCPIDKACCGAECCVPTAAFTLPLWAIILIVVLLTLLLLLLLSWLLWWLFRRKRQETKYYQHIEPPVPGPSDKRPKPAAQIIETQTPSTFVPDPMEVTHLPPVRPIDVAYHSESEISQERLPRIQRVVTPEPTHARLINIRQGTDEVAAYNRAV